MCVVGGGGSCFATHALSLSDGGATDALKIYGSVAEGARVRRNVEARLLCLLVAAAAEVGDVL